MNFIKKIKIKNFFSIKNEVEIDFSADTYTIQNHPYRIFNFNNKAFNIIKAIYGANASGKTSILRAIVFTSFLLTNKGNHFPPHFANIYSEDNESFIELEFVISGRNFSYYIDFEIENNKIIGIKNENLKLDDKIILNRKKKIIKDFNYNPITNILLEKISNRQSIISILDIITDDYDKLINFFKGIVLLSNIVGSHDVATQLRPEENILLAGLFSKKDVKIFKGFYENIDKTEFYKFFKEIIRQIGLDIEDVKASIEEKENSINLKFNTIHSIDTSKELPFKLESHGTQNIFKLIFDFYYAYKNNTILVIDELDIILHPFIVPIFLSLAIENKIQLIYSTHNIYNLKNLYKDEVVIIEKDKNHNTKIIEPKFNEKIEGYKNLLKLYEKNILGGVPNVEKKELRISKIIRGS